MDHDIRLISQLKPVLQSLRKARGLTQAQLARRLGVVQSRIADIEADPGSVSVAQWFEILGVLGVGLVLRDDRAAPLGPPSGDDATAAPTARPGPLVPDDPDDPPVGRW